MSTSRTALLARVFAFLAAALFFGGPLAIGANLLPPELGFRLFLLGALLGFITLLLGAIALLRTRDASGKSGRSAAWLALGIGLALTTTVLVAAGPTADLPLINDITTNPDRPPSFVAIAALPELRGADLTYPAEFAALQRSGYPELRPIQVDTPPKATLERIEQLVDAFGWHRIARNDEQGRIEAAHTTRIFRFVDDIVIRVTGLDDGSVVDVRSRSRVGKGDLGANAARIEALRAKLIQ